MTGFTGTYELRVLPGGAVRLPPVWAMAALASDPGGTPGPNLLVMPHPGGRFDVVTADAHRDMALRVRMLDPRNPRRRALERIVFQDCFAVALVNGTMPGSQAFDRVPGLQPDGRVRLSGKGHTFVLEPAT